MYDFINTLVDNHEHSNEHLQPYSVLIGDWDFTWVGKKDDGSRWEVPGQWHFSWILAGRAIQDNWICPRIDFKNTGVYPEGEYGTTIRFYDHKEGRIKVVWIGPALSNLSVFAAERDGDRIVQNELFPRKEKLSRWMFRDITGRSFKWEAHVSHDQGKSWDLEQEVFATRM